MSKDRLQDTDSIAELARFWDTHDLTDFEDELQEVTEPVFEPSGSITLCLEASEAEAVRKLATSKGLKDTELIREWIQEKIHAR